jgi:UMF1 family MFS transporter
MAEVTGSGRLERSAGPLEIWAWAMYDFANSGYTTVVLTAIFNAYFVAVVANNAPWATFAWTATLSLSYALVILTAPLIGAYADLRACKKRLLLVSTAACVLSTAGLALAGPGDLAIAAVCVVVSNFFFCTGCDLIAAFLPELARGRNLGKVSGWGWSLGYIGGLLTLGACLAYIASAQAAGDAAARFVPVTMLITAALFALASLPTFAFLRERASPQPLPAGKSLFVSAFARLADTIRHAARYEDLRRFLWCIVFYQAGVQTVITLAAIYADQAMGFSTQDTLVLVLVVNVTAALGAFFLGTVQDRIGHVPTIALTLGGWIATVLIVWVADTRPVFWIAANLAGLCMGASQSAGRALVGYLSPSTRRAEFFGLWGLATNLSSILGPLTYGAVSWISQGNHRLAMLFTGVFFVAGLLLLRGIDARRGRRAALKRA